MRVFYGLQPVLFATAPVLSCLASNMDSFAVGAATRALVLVAGGTLILWGLLCATLRDLRKSALMSCLVVMLFWSWTSRVALLPEPLWIAPVAMGLLWGAGLSLVAVLLAHASFDLTPVYRIVTIAGLIGVVFPLASLVRFEAPRSPATIALMGHEEADQPHEPGHVGTEFARRYRAQAAYLSERVSETAREILQRSPEPPIILILGDHGPYGFSPNIRHPRFAILNAFFLPDGGDELLYPTISPVNSLRIVINQYFGAELSMLADRRFRASYHEPNVYEEIF